MRTLCRYAQIAFAGRYAGALAILVVGSYGLFGAARDPLSGVYLLPLALPWAYMLGPVPEAVRPWAVAAAPALNLLILREVCVRIGRRPPDHTRKKESRK